MTNNKQNNYITITIGPIYKTLQGARRTRELWGASYLFSWLMKQIIEALKKKGLKKEEDLKNENFVVPYIDDAVLSPKNGVGLFPDSLLLRSGDVEKVETAIAAAKQMLVAELNSSGTFVEDYFRIYYKVFEADSDIAAALKFGAINAQLDLKERVVSSFPEASPIAKLLDRANNSFLSQDAFGKEGVISFRTILQYALSELRDGEKHKDKFLELKRKVIATQQDPDKKDDEFDTKLIPILRDGFPDNFHNYHKYIAIVTADGDKIGETIKSFTEEKDLSKFSENLFEFGKKAATTIKNYGGVPIYIGGDDLLFFAPIHNGNNNIIELCKEMADAFKEQIGGKVTLSFGISISYYKYPLYSALEAAHELLHTAKEPDRNGIAWRVLTHSGQYYETRQRQDSESFTAFLDLLNSSGFEKDHLKSVIQHFRTAEPTLWEIMRGDEKRIENYFANFFNERIHTERAAFFAAIGKMIGSILKTETDTKKALSTAYALLQTISFTKGYDQTDE